MSGNKAGSEYFATDSTATGRNMKDWASCKPARCSSWASPATLPWTTLPIRPGLVTPPILKPLTAPSPEPGALAPNRPDKPPGASASDLELSLAFSASFAARSSATFDHSCSKRGRRRPCASSQRLKMVPIQRGRSWAKIPQNASPEITPSSIARPCFWGAAPSSFQAGPTYVSSMVDGESLYRSICVCRDDSVAVARREANVPTATAAAIVPTSKKSVIPDASSGASSTLFPKTPR
mmetsp:Transcript_5070/g.20254  ORF Transcript_5070/g.20254 Transcript_5070/m.20254 type:complete len:237 (+) Transcript_5070:377-1087(+)